MVNQLSLVMPVHGPAPFLTAAIESVYKSADVGIEFILILDRCTNSEFQKVIEDSPAHVEMKVIVSALPGIVPALNLGITKSRNELIARLDSDDLVTPERFLRQIQFLHEHEEVVCVGSQMTFIDEEGNEFGYTNYPIKNSDIQQRMKYQNCIGHPSSMFRKSIVQKVGGYREFLTGSEDYDLWLRLSGKGKLENLPLRLTKYRKSKFQYTNQITSNQPTSESACRISNAMCKLNIIENLPDKDGSLTDVNSQNFLEIKRCNSKVASELKAADYLNSAYRVWAAKNSITKGLLKVAKLMILAGWFSPNLLVSFVIGRIRYAPIRKSTLKGLNIVN